MIQKYLLELCQVGHCTEWIGYNVVDSGKPGPVVSEVMRTFDSD